MFTERLTDVSEQLSDDSDVLVDALDELGVALDELNGFLNHNGAATTRTVASLQRFTHNLASHRQHTADILQAAPTALSNYYNTYYPDAPAMTGTFVSANLDSPATFICSSLYSLGGTPSQCEALLAPIAKFLKVPVNPIGIVPIERNGGNGAAPGPDSSPQPTPAPLPTPKATSSNDHVDLLGSLMLGLVP
jgi:phospholipid/cholesterol/gamma-HCH transport system substrate-binding protein